MPCLSSGSSFCGIPLSGTPPLFRYSTVVPWCSGYSAGVPRSVVPVFRLSGGIKVRIPQELDVVAFSSWNLDVVVFQSWNLDVVAFWSWNLDVVAFWSWNLDVVAFWSWNLDVVYMCLRGLIFVIIVKTKKSRIIMSIMLKNTSVVQIYATSICIMCASVQV